MKRTEQGADVDRQIEDAEGLVATPVAGRVQVADQRADVGLEQPVSDGSTPSAGSSARRAAKRQAGNSPPARISAPTNTQKRREREAPGRASRRKRRRITGRQIASRKTRRRAPARSRAAHSDTA